MKGQLIFLSLWLVFWGWSVAAEEPSTNFPPPIDLERELESLIDLRDEEFEASLRAAEEDIPVLTGRTETGPVESSTYGRLLVSLLIVLGVALGLVVASRRWISRAQRDESLARVRLITQLHLGPKRSVAIINVAGESLLIGVTDHNISLLRNLSLLDEEIPDSVPRDFDQALAEGDLGQGSVPGQTQDNSPRKMEDVNMSSVRKLVADRLKQMRPL